MVMRARVPSVRTLGIDLSADPKKTAACSIVWARGRAHVESVALGLVNDELLEQMDDADWVGIDAPFGWPLAFLEAVRGWTERGTWPAVGRDRLRYRETDRFVRKTARMPLSVSSDRIAVTAMRCAELLTELARRRSRDRLDRSGGDRVVEVYPGAALPRWSETAAGLRLDPQGYKGDKGLERRQILVGALLGSAPWLEVPADTRRELIRNDDVLDALLSSLVARAAARGETMGAETDEQREFAPVEGWIHLPAKGSLRRLVD
jgi:predicted nuclease with RNAse H fold